VSRVESPALRGTWIGSLLRFWNPVMRALLASPLHWPLSRWFLLISWTGAKTGLARSTPVSYVRDGTTIYVTTGDRWPRYVMGNDTFRVRQRGRWVSARAELVTDREESSREHARIFARHGWFRLLAGIPKRGGRVDEKAINRSLEAGRQLVWIALDESIDK
jgi:F420H(2)-dependent quinone reductase